MNTTHYLVAGASHAGLEAVHRIRLVDGTSPITLVTRDAHAPYSPTILPYVVSGQSAPERVVLRPADYFLQHNITLISDNELVSIDETGKQVTLKSGDRWQYAKLLLATGADPIIPPIPGLSETPFHVLRTMQHAIDLRDHAGKAKRAVVLGAGLIGMHGAENLRHAGLDVTIVEMCDQVLPGYFDARAAALIEHAFNANGIRMLMGSRVVRVEPLGDGCRITLENGDSLEADLLLVATGVKPQLDYLKGTSVQVDQGILVDRRMRTDAPHIWAAGDVAQAADFYGEEKVMMGILPDAVTQGAVAAMDMTEDHALKPYIGGVPINTYTFFGQQAISVGQSLADASLEELTRVDEENGRYLKILLRENRLQGISSINQEMDAGIMWQLILRKVDLTPVKDAFIARPLETGRALMSSTWR
ncbi:NADH-dependent phenylglyoxylate dehydrogenase subunit epsilon [Sedimenticola hydrogenitrophicus]|uniref:NADH-dependent phenylglyoxylate dehydrogenase subunit epsilon n=1 Tax=Sedimenticola hydrogenitrophicus TaxID=2967975 RepID=UPI0021A814A6|nr:FAD-dependent oxidoreductase [Sedimenticola hydrogenitrophicus]